MSPYEETRADLQNDDEISLSEIFEMLWGSRRLIASVSVLSTAIAAAIAFSLPVYYRSEVLVMPASSEHSGGALSNIAGQFGGLASLAGISGGGDGKKSEAIATLGSRALTEDFIQANKLLPVLFAKEWDAKANAWHKDLKKRPTEWQGVKHFSEKIRAISNDKKTGLVTLSIEWTDPALAAAWANQLVQRTNDTLRERAIATSRRNLAYLDAQLEKTSVIELRQSIFRLTEAEIKNIMLAEGNKEYAFKIIDPAVVPEEKSRPKRGQMIVGGLAIALVLSSLFVLLRGSRKRQ